MNIYCVCHYYCNCVWIFNCNVCIAIASHTLCYCNNKALCLWYSVVQFVCVCLSDISFSILATDLLLLYLCIHKKLETFWQLEHCPILVGSFFLLKRAKGLWCANMCLIKLYAYLVEVLVFLKVSDGRRVKFSIRCKNLFWSLSFIKYGSVKWHFSHYPCGTSLQIRLTMSSSGKYKFVCNKIESNKSALNCVQDWKKY